MSARHALDCGLCCGLAECDCGVDAMTNLEPLNACRPASCDALGAIEVSSYLRLLAEHVIALEQEIARLKEQRAQS